MNSTHMDFDLWARLIAGMGVVDGGEVLKYDFLSYTPRHIWYDHEYGSGVVFYFLLKYFGAYSLIIFQMLIYFGIFFLVSRIIKLRGNNSPYGILFYIFPIMALSVNFSSPIRCHLFSFLFFTLFIYLLELARLGKNKPLFLIPILIIIWNNLHGGVVAGLGLIFMYALGEFLNKKPFRKYLITLAVSTPLLIINPWGWEYIKFLLMANTMKRPEITEWWGLFSKFHLFKQIPFKIFMFGAIFVELAKFIKSVRHPELVSGSINTDLSDCSTMSSLQNKFKMTYESIDKTKFIVLAGTLYLAIAHIKLLPFFTIAGSVFVYEDVCEIIKSYKFPKNLNKIIYTTILIITGFSLCLKDYSIPLSEETYPVKEVEFIKINNIKGKLLTNFGLGSYVSYKLYPNNLIFMDGRYEEVYYDYMVPLLKKFYLVNPGWDEVLQYFLPDVMIIEKYYPIYGVLRKSKDWSNIYESKVFGVFVKSDDVKSNYKLPPDDIKYYKKTLFDTNIKFKKRDKK